MEESRKALYFEPLEESKVRCVLCPHHCLIASGKSGICGVRENRSGQLYGTSYGEITSISLDPIEKKPLARFHPGSSILSVGSFGCNLKCSFCQNHGISMEKPDSLYLSPRELVDKALALVPRGNIGIAYTYNEPLISYEYVLDCSRLARREGLKNVLVTNGYISQDPLAELLAFIDAMNIDLKSFQDDFYLNICGGLTSPVKQTITMSSETCHVEITTLIIPGANDSEREMEDLAKWLASVDPAIPLHINRFFPRYKMQDRPPTPVQTIHTLAGIARKHLAYVYTGNL